MFNEKILAWSKAVLARDGKCMECGSISDLHAHHIKRRNEDPKRWLDVDNGVTLCGQCQRKRYEKDRKVRIGRSKSPQKKTLVRRIEELERLVLWYKSRELPQRKNRG